MSSYIRITATGEPEGEGTVVRVRYPDADPTVCERINGRWYATGDPEDHSWPTVSEGAAEILLLYPGEAP